MTRVEVFEKEIKNLDREICNMERLNMTNDKYYYLLQIERNAKICELQYCIENNL